MIKQEQQNNLGKIFRDISDDLREVMDADDYSDYMIAFLFLYYLSNTYQITAKKELGKDYPKAQADTTPLQQWYKTNKKKDIEGFEVVMRRKLHYVIKPKHLWGNIVSLALNQSKVLLENLGKSFKYIESESFESTFNGLFSEANLSSERLGKSQTERNVTLCKVINVMTKNLAGTSADNGDLGNAYEYFIGQFTPNFSEKNDEPYTPQPISSILAGIVTLDYQDTKIGKRKQLDKVLDFACGSGSLLLNVRKKMGVGNIGKIYGQEKNITIYNLARMNMLLHGVKDSAFEIFHGDTLQNEWKLFSETNPAKKPMFDAVVANPPFSHRWEYPDDADNDMRFKGYDLAPKCAADSAFLLHGFHYLKKDGTMAIVLPHGVLFRGGADKDIREKLLEGKNIDTVIGLPANLLYSTGIPVCILVLKKCARFSNVLFIDASEQFEKGRGQNFLLEEHIKKIIETYKERKEEKGYSRRVSMKEIEKNKYGLDISRYISTDKLERIVDLKQVNGNLQESAQAIKQQANQHNKLLKELDIPHLS